MSDFRDLNVHKLIAFALIALVLPADADDAGKAPDPAGILEQSDKARGGGLPGIRWEVRVVAKDGEKVEEQAMIVQADKDNTLVEFLEPRNIADQKMLISGRNVWFIRSGLRRPVPISPRQRLIGQAATGDVAATNYAGDYEAEFLGVEEVDGEPAYKLDLHARSDRVTYPRIHYWVSQNTGLAVKAEFCTVSGRVYKTATFAYANEIEYEGKRIPFVSEMVIEDRIERDRRTTLSYSDVEAADLPRRIFDINFLVR